MPLSRVRKRGHVAGTRGAHATFLARSLSVPRHRRSPMRRRWIGGFCVASGSAATGGELRFRALRRCLSQKPIDCKRVPWHGHCVKRTHDARIVHAEEWTRSFPPDFVLLWYLDCANRWVEKSLFFLCSFSVSLSALSRAVESSWKTRSRSAMSRHRVLTSLDETRSRISCSAFNFGENLGRSQRLFERKKERVFPELFRGFFAILSRPRTAEREVGHYVRSQTGTAMSIDIDSRWNLFVLERRTWGLLR